MPTAANTHSTPTRRRALFGVAAVTVAAVARVPARASGNPDADLIAACNRIVAIEAEQAAIYAGQRTADDEQRTEPALDALCAEAQVVIRRIYDAPDTETLAGLEAMSRAARALAPKDLDGSLSYPAGDAEWIAFEVSRYLVEGIAA